jgi:hypothetical protein
VGSGLTLHSAASHNPEPHKRTWQIGWPSRRHILESRAPRSTWIITPRTVCRKPHDQVVQQNLCAVLHREPREPVGASPLAGVAAEANEHIGEVHKATDAHLSRGYTAREQNANGHK